MIKKAVNRFELNIKLLDLMKILYHIWRAKGG